MWLKINAKGTSKFETEFGMDINIATNIDFESQ